MGWIDRFVESPSSRHDQVMDEWHHRVNGTERRVPRTEGGKERIKDLEKDGKMPVSKRWKYDRMDDD